MSNNNIFKYHGNLENKLCKSNAGILTRLGFLYMYTTIFITASNINNIFAMCVISSLKYMLLHI